MIPAGDPTEMAFKTLLPLLEDGDVLVDGGNSNFRDSIRRAEEAKAKGVGFLDAGVWAGSGASRRATASWSAARRPRSPVEPVFATLAPEGGYAHVGPSGAGPLREDGAQRDRVRAHAGLRRGLRAHARRSSLRPRPRADLRALAARLGRPELAARAAGAGVRRRPRPRADPRRYVQDSGEGRWTVHEAIDAAVPRPRSRPRSSRASPPARTSPSPPR